ncbi:hypothetical protein [Tranquillimonas rosea]|uniref:hypothetical protein n=1 Tax=Tranquillimonas rosea TaxID=641238 RepID=UPI000B8444CB|nr:hypothetical protein [Tranquillimonas rosea]
MARDPAGRLLHLAKRERAALLAGKLDQLPGLLAEHESLIERLAKDPPDAETLHRLRTDHARNQSLFKAALAGLAAARDRLSAISDGVPLETYSARGTRQGHRTDRKRLVRRA